MTVQISKMAEEKTKQAKEPPKLLWPGHLEEGKSRKVIEELEDEGIRPYDDASKRYCRVSKYLYDETFIETSIIDRYNGHNRDSG